MKNLAPWFGLVFGIVICCLAATFFNENPIQVFKLLLTSFYATKYDLGLTLFYTTCFIFSAISFTIPIKAGLFHIGTEGQLTFAGLICAYLGIQIIPLQSIFSIYFCLFLIAALTILSTVLVASLIGALKVYKQAHEVVVAIMFNFLLAAFTTWATINKLQNPNSQNPETALISPSLQVFQNDFLKTYFDGSPVSMFLFLAILCCLGLYWAEKKWLIAFQIKAYGFNPKASERLGVSNTKIVLIVFALAGLFSALVGLTEVLGSSYQFKIGFSPMYGFLGIAVALLARQNFIGIVSSAFLMACLHKGASDLDLETEHLTRDFSKVLQAVIIFSVAASYFIFNKLSSAKKSSEPETTSLDIITNSKNGDTNG